MIKSCYECPWFRTKHCPRGEYPTPASADNRYDACLLVTKLCESWEEATELEAERDKQCNWRWESNRENCNLERENADLKKALARAKGSRNIGWAMAKAKHIQRKTLEVALKKVFNYCHDPQCRKNSHKINDEFCIRCSVVINALSKLP